MEPHVELRNYLKQWVGGGGKAREGDRTEPEYDYHDRRNTIGYSKIGIWK